MPNPITGTFTALITPFQEDGEIDWESLRKVVDFQIEQGIDGLVPCGTTGESPTLSHKEHIEVIEKVVKWSKEKKENLPIIAGTGSNSTEEALFLTKEAAKVGADYALVVNPYYNKPTQEGLKKHFLKLAEESPIPIILYNIPGRTAVKLSEETLIDLSMHPNIVGVKEATGDLSFMIEIIREAPHEFSLLSGDDTLLLPILSIGGRGVISVISNIYPKETAEITRVFLEGHYQAAREKFLRIFPLAKAMFVETNPIPVKFLASKKGLCKNILRLPLVPLSKKFEPYLEELREKFEKTS